MPFFDNPPPPPPRFSRSLNFLRIFFCATTPKGVTTITSRASGDANNTILGIPETKSSILQSKESSNQKMQENKLALTTDIPKTSIISNSNEEIRDAIENGATCVLNSECATGTKCVKHRGLYGVCK